MARTECRRRARRVGAGRLNTAPRRATAGRAGAVLVYFRGAARRTARASSAGGATPEPARCVPARHAATARGGSRRTGAIRAAARARGRVHRARRAV